MSRRSPTYISLSISSPPAFKAFNERLDNEESLKAESTLFLRSQSPRRHKCASSIENSRDYCDAPKW